MTILKINTFAGMIPRLPPERLPDGAAEYAENCDFAHGELRSLKGPAPRLATTGAVRSLFTDDGLRFYAWPDYTRACLAPTIDDTFGRVYFNTAGQGVRVAQTLGMSSALSNPRPPVSSWKAGVKRPAAPEAIVIPVMITQVSVEVVQDGVVVKAVDISSTRGDIVDWVSFTVTVPADLMDGLSTEPDPAAADAQGWVSGADELSATWQENGFEMGMYDVSNVFAGGTWQINQYGQVKLGGATVDAHTVTYKGTRYTPASLLYAELLSGEAAVTGSALDLQFRVLMLDAGGAVVSEAIYPHAANGEIENSYILSVPKSVAGEVQTVAYVAVAVNDWGEESAPSDPILVERRDSGLESAVLRVTHTPDPDQRPISGLLFYRTYAGFTNASYFLVSETPAVGTGGVYPLTDTTTEPATTITLAPSQAYWDEPPIGAKWMAYAGNGILCAADGRDLVLTEPYRCHAWAYRMTFPHAITGIIEADGGVLVTTTARPYFVYGAHPEQMTQQAINAEQAGITGRAMARVEGAAIYVSNDGLVRASGGQASIAESQHLFTRNDWRSAYKAHFPTMALSAWDGRLFGILDGQTDGHFVLSFGEASSYAHLDAGRALTGIAVSATTDETYLLYADGFAEFGGGEDMALVWHSKQHEFPRPTAFAAGILRCRGSFTVEVHRDGALIHTETVTHTQDAERAFRLPPAGRGSHWQIRIAGTGTFSRIELGASFEELKHG
ncbi:hypothetical protein [Thauera aromatica]|uniref:hypothetical protein n=1 Tax=Thauera aromatica TaxID=59405 RepID=UPI001FFC8993|nr:hypothetical protein [Thauera aromatica]MCK2097658.1 hypothetical protein [Thauera aromatica]